MNIIYWKGLPLIMKLQTDAKKEVITMLKKALGLVITAVMALGVFGLTACTESLGNYKSKGKAAIDAHVATKTQSEYSTENWAELLNVAAEGKQAVENAMNKGAVDTTVNNTKIAINAVKEDVGMGRFYTLQEAFDEGFLTVPDLQIIATYYNNKTDPLDILNDTTVKTIKETYRESVINMPTVSLDGIIIMKYYGTFNGNIAIGITDDYHAYDYVIFDELDIEGVIFYKIHDASIRIWSNKAE